MIDLKILSIRDLLTIFGVEYANVSPLSIIITGEKFSDATKVLINDLEATEYMILSSNRIIAQVPDSERKSPITRLAVLADRPSTNRSSIMHFEVGVSIKGLSGLERLVQMFCKLLLQTPGSDKFRPSEGGGLLSIVGRNISRHDSRTLQSSVVSAVSRTRDQILSVQAQNPRIPADERLLTAQIQAIAFDPSTTSVSSRVSLAAVSGREAVANLTF